MISCLQPAVPQIVSVFVPRVWSPCCWRGSSDRRECGQEESKGRAEETKAPKFVQPKNNMKRDEGFGLDLFCFGAFQGARHAVVFGLGRKAELCRRKSFSDFTLAVTGLKKSQEA